jgi:hypothetical protein
MVSDTELSLEDLAILEEAVGRALDLGDKWNIVFQSGQLAVLLCAGFLRGERDPKMLADMAVRPLRVLH